MKVLKISKETEIILGSIGAVQSTFMAVYLFFGKKRNTTNSLLSLFFILITIRITKSLLWVYVDTVPDWFLNFGFIAHYATGPCLFLYFLRYSKQNQWSQLHYLHFIPALLLLPFLFTLDLNNFWYKGGYTFLLYHQIAYTILTMGLLIYYCITKKHTIVIDLRNRTWLILLLLGTASIQVAYFSNYILGFTPYLAGPVIYAVFIYIIAFYGFMNQDIFNSNRRLTKYQNINIPDKDFITYKNKIKEIMSVERPFLNRSFTLNELSRQISLPPYLTSHIINKGFGTSFSDFVNYYRIHEAKIKLTSPSNRHIKISSIAYDCGFHSLSSFNSSFKKVVGITPSQFKKSNCA